MTKVSFHTLGCRANQAETSVLEGLFRQHGFEVVGEDDAADIAVINTCTVTADGERDALKLVNRVRRCNPMVRVALIGCHAQLKRGELLQWPGVCWVVGNAHKMRLPGIMDEHAGGLPAVFVGPIPRRPFTMPLTSGTLRRTRGNLKVQDGCDNFCAYCEVPYARGRSRSRLFEDVILGARALVEVGCREIVLTGINTGLYHDRGRSLLDIIRELEQLPALDRIRLSSLEFGPLIVELGDWMLPPHKLCRHLHIPVQSGCDVTLKRMGRRYHSLDVARALADLVRKVPGIMLGTDVIAGFPGESDGDFRSTIQFLNEQPFHYFHVFPYSQRRRARSRMFKDIIPEEVVRERARLLRDLNFKKKREFLGGLLGARLHVLFEQKKDGQWVGYSDNYVKIKVFSDVDLRNRIETVEIEQVAADTLKGRLV